MVKLPAGNVDWEVELIVVIGAEAHGSIAIACSLSGEPMQASTTSLMIYDVPELIARLSAVCTLFPGDLIFSGTPAGVGNRRVPPRFIRPDDVLVSEIEGVGRLTTTFR